jgi:lysozyme
MTLDQARAFVTHVHQATGRWPGFYSGHYIKEWIGRERDAVLSQCWFWLTQYRPKPAVPPCWRTWTMWQYTDGGMGPEPHTVDGIGRCDRDKFNGALARLEALWGIRPPARVGRGRRAGARARRRKALESPRSA